LRLAAAFSAANAHPPAPAGNTGHSALKSNADSNEKADLEAVHDLSLRGLSRTPLDRPSSQSSLDFHYVVACH
jgi:hypothetical protein